jgi:iron complex outermembrane receptor protein
MTARLLLCTTMLVSLSAGSAFAQASAPAAAAPEEAALAEVIVTAQKREESLQDVPISMEVVSGDKLQDFGTNDFKQLVRFTPNVSVQTTAGNDTIYIRGFGSPPANFSFDQAVSLYMDGVYAGRARQAQSPFFDLARVEVLRGPQGALFGKNTPAGAVSIVSAGPGNEFDAAITGVYNFNLRGYDIWGHVSGPISDTLGARLAVKLTDNKGYLRNETLDRREPQNEQALARLTLAWRPTDTLDYTLKVEYANRDVTGGLNVSSSATGPQKPDKTRNATVNAIGPEGTKTTSWLASATGNLELGEFTLTSVTGYSFFRSNIVNNFDLSVPGTNTVTPNSTYNSYPEHFRQWSQEVRLLSPTGRKLEYVVGVYYDTSLYQLQQLGGFNIASLNYFGLLETNFRQRAQSFSVFGQGTFHVTDELRLLGSLRYTTTDKRGHFNGRLRYGPYALRPVNTVANGEINGEDILDPSATLQYDITDRIMVYATYGRGSKSGGFVSNTYGTTNATFIYRPERSTNYEIGLKSTLLDGRMVLNLAAYDTSFKDLQVSIYNPTISTYQTSNAASASSKGIEGSMVFFPTRNFDITLAGAYQDATYDDYPGAACLASQPLTQCNPAVPASIAANNIAGARLTHTSKFSGTAQLHHKIELANEQMIDWRLAASGRSKFFNSDNQSPLYGVQKGYVKVDLRVQYGPEDERWHVAFVGKNLTDELTTGSAFLLPAPITAVPRAILYVEEGRTLSLEAGMRF